MTAQLRVARQGLTLVLSISNLQQRNALDPVMYVQGIDALEQARADHAVASVVLTGDGAVFSAGGNMQRLQSNRQLPASVQAESIEGLHSWIRAIRAFPKPVIAAVEGAAAGAGFSLALSCDFIVAARNAVFVMAYSNIALSPDGGGSWHLARSLPRQLVSELLMCGEKVEAPRLHALGLVNRIADAGQALPQALGFASGLNRRAGNALASIKALVNEAAQGTLEQQLRHECAHFVQNLHHPNAGIGIAAFLSKQPPHYE